MNILFTFYMYYINKLCKNDICGREEIQYGKYALYLS